MSSNLLLRFFSSDKSVLGLYHATCPKTNRSQFWNKWEVKVMSCCDFYRSFTLCSQGSWWHTVYQIPSQCSSSFREKQNMNGYKTTFSSVHNLSFQPLLEIEPVDAFMHLFRRVEPQFMICSRRSMLNNLFLNSFPTQPAGRWNQNDFWRQLWLWSTTNKCYQATGEQRITHHIMFFDWGPLS